jgi:hypothetical protein
VKADGQGELLLNGKPLPRPPVKGLLGAVMDFQGKLKVLTDADHFVRGLMVFPSAYVEASYGSTRQIHCLRSLRNQTFSAGLQSTDVERIKLATLQLAGMDRRFHVAD